MDGIDKLIDSIKRIIRKETEAYDTAATVRRIEGDTAWVHIDGGVDETPVKLTINAQPGDNVQVRVSGGKAFLVGNGSAPPTDDRVANYARSIATTAQTTAEGAQEAAEAVTGIATAASANASTAITLAEGIDDHFWSDSAGAHITEDTQEDYQADPSAAGGNTLITSAGMAIRHGTTQLAAFTSSGAQIGQNANGQTRTVLSTGGMQVIQKESGGTDVQIVNLGYDSGVDKEGSVATAPLYTLGIRKPGDPYDPGELYTFNDVAEYNGVLYVCTANTIGAWDATKWVPAIGNYSTSEGYDNIASGYCSHAEGSSNAYGYCSHAEGSSNAYGYCSHAEGNAQSAYGDNSHAEGYGTIASGDNSHASGEGTQALGKNQTVIGRFNYLTNATKDDYPFIIGNGTESPWVPSNALTVDWSGNVEAAGDIEDGSGNILSNIAKIQNTYGTLNTLSSELSLSTSAQKVPINTFTGSNCYKSSNGIKVTDAGVYEVSGSAYFKTGFTANDLIHLQIRVGTSTTVVESVKRVTNASPYEILIVPTTIVTLNANDVVYLYAYNQSGARGTVASYTGNGLVLKRIA